MLEISIKTCEWCKWFAFMVQCCKVSGNEQLLYI